MTACGWRSDGGANNCGSPSPAPQPYLTLHIARLSSWEGTRRANFQKSDMGRCNDGLCPFDELAKSNILVFAK